MKKATTVTNKSKTCFLPQNYQPGNNDVILGRGKKRSTHEGNKRLRSLVTLRLEEYALAVRKSEKSEVLAAVLREIRTGNPNGKFVKQDPNTELWFDVGDVLAREKISQAFRDALVGLYRSSNDFKKKRRKDMLKAESARQNKQEQSQAMSFSLNESLPSVFEPLSNSFKPIKMDTSSFARLVSSTPEYEHPFEPTPLKDMLGKNKGTCENEGSFIRRVTRDKYSDCTNIVKQEALEDIDTSGLIPLSLDSTFIWGNQKLSGCNVNRECFSLNSPTRLSSSKLA